MDDVVVMAVAQRLQDLSHVVTKEGKKKKKGKKKNQNPIKTAG